MTETQTDTFDTGIGVLGTHENKQQRDLQINDPVTVSGVLIPEETVVEGGQGVRYFFDADALQQAETAIQSQIEDETVHIVKNFHELDGQAPTDDIIGEITGVRHSPGVGLLFEGEVTDRDIAEKVANGYLSVSPSVHRSLGNEVDPQREARPVTHVTGLRDAAIIGRGQRGAEVELGPNPSVGTLARDVLNRAFGDTTLDVLRQVAGVEFTGTAGGTLDESELSAEEHTLSDHYLYGSGEDKEDFSYPVVDADGDLRRGNVDSAHQLGCRGQCDDAEAHDRRLRELAMQFDTPPEWATENDTMSVDDAKETVAEEYDIDLDELEARLDDDGGTDDPEDGHVRLVEP